MRPMIDKIRAHFAILASSILFVLLLSLFLWLIYLHSADQILQQQTRKTQSLAAQGLTNIENELRGVLERMKAIEGHEALEKVVRLGEDSAPTERIAPLYMLKSRLCELYPTSGREALSEVMILFDTPAPYGVSTASILDDLTLSMQAGTFRCGDLDARSFMDLVREHSAPRQLSRPLVQATSVRIDETDLGHCFLYAYKPLQLSKRCAAYVVVLLSEAAIATELSPEGFSITLHTNWLSPEAPPSASGGQAPAVSRLARATFIQGVSNPFGLTYSIRLDDSDVLARVHGFKTAILLLVALSVTLAVAACALFASLSIHRMNVMRNALGAQDEKTPPAPSYQAIAEQIRVLSAQNRRNAQLLNGYESMHVRSILERVFSAMPVSREEEDVVSSFLTTAPADQCFRVALIPHPCEGDESSAQDAAARVRESLIAQWGSPVLFCLKKKRYLVFLCAFPAIIPEADLRFSLLCESGDALQPCIGCAVHTCAELRVSFAQARERFHEMSRRAPPEVAYSPESLLPYRDINRLHHLLLSGDADGAVQLLHPALERAQSAPEDVLQKGALTYLVSDVCHLCERALLCAGQECLCEMVHEKQNALMRTFDGETLLDLLRFAARACAQEKSPSPEAPLVAAIVEFVNTHYADSLLSLASLAGQFHMSEKYLSSFFKSKTGVKFSVYLENLRIQCAQEMLLAQKHSVAQIALTAGYTSPNTFYKAFKRYTGVTPSQWQQQQSASAVPPAPDSAGQAPMC